MLAGIRNTIAGVFGRAPTTKDAHTRPDVPADPEAGGGLTTASGIQIGFDDDDTATPVGDGGGEGTGAGEADSGPTTASGIQIGFDDDDDTATPVDDGSGEGTGAGEADSGPTTASGIQIGFDDDDTATPIDDGGDATGDPEDGGKVDGGFGTGDIQERPATVPDVRGDIGAFGSGELTRPTEHPEAAAVPEAAPPEVEVPPLQASPLVALAPTDVDAYRSSGGDESPPIEELTSTEDPDVGGDIA